VRLHPQLPTVCVPPIKQSAPDARYQHPCLAGPGASFDRDIAARITSDGVKRLGAD